MSREEVKWGDTTFIVIDKAVISAVTAVNGYDGKLKHYAFGIANGNVINSFADNLKATEEERAMLPDNFVKSFPDIRKAYALTVENYGDFGQYTELL